jgi:hypothetical protein
MLERRGWPEASMRPIRLEALSSDQLSELDELYQTTHDARVRIRALMVLLAAERQMVATEIASIVRQHEETVRRWLARYEAEGTAGLADAPRSGAGVGAPSPPGTGAAVFDVDGRSAGRLLG